MATSPFPDCTVGIDICLIGKCFLCLVYKIGQGFHGGTVVKNPPANAGDTGSSPGPGRSHMPRSNEARAPQLLSLCSTARALEPVLRNKRSHCSEKPVHRNEE